MRRCSLQACSREASVHTSSQRARDKPRHHPFDRLGEKRIATEIGDLDMEIGADLVPLLARHIGATRVEHGLDGIEIGLGRALAGEPHRRDVERLAKFRERFDLAEIDWSNLPVPAVPLHQPLAFQPHQCRANGRAGALELAFQPAFGQPLAGPQIQRQDHLPKLIVDQQHLRHVRASASDKGDGQIVS